MCLFMRFLFIYSLTLLVGYLTYLFIYLFIYLYIDYVYICIQKCIHIMYVHIPGFIYARMYNIYIYIYIYALVYMS